MSRSRAAGLVLGYAADRLLGDPARWHPVAGFGRATAALEQRLYADRRGNGAAFTSVAVGAAALGGVLVERRTADHPARHVLATAVTTWAVLGGRSLGREATAVGDHVLAGDLDAARHRVRSLVGRDPRALDADQLARAVVESVAENTSDAVVAPLWWGAVAGVPGLVGYRAVNTLDAMVGHRSDRYRRFGWASARLDDVANLVPARLAAALATVASPLVGGRPSAAWRAWREDAPGHPSPNAGAVEAAFAGALGVRLGGVNHYEGVMDERVRLGDGTPPAPADVPRSVRLASAVGAGALVVAAAVTLRPRR
ncbi:MAG: cobalamin biosynthesis protein [Aeromicrobium sp.]|uniref:cobalamin biosynthesis protein n=1 Tax=Aeromicrobium sp. TaxID=1871063 RepID=UPI002616EC39|nr:cobalamin biosynthesis protein [Aeromicrobium sp.]MDF1705651.1 cobalamin biosynthesis protein [Aeromicrobium sp.]